ncbi:MAG: hypothetical protein ISS63_07345 [Desulfobacteraceae bacterium]|nr:hypothetical protein [Desulfobacteraceae bacterium]
MKIGIIYHGDLKKYDFGLGHPLSDKYCINGNIAFSLVKNNKDIEEKAEIAFIEPPPATEEDILLVHTEEYIDFIKDLNEKGGFVAPGTSVSKGMYDTAKLSAGADILAGQLIVNKSLNKGVVFGIIGHHAGADFGGRFSLINDIAIMINYLSKNYGLKRILVIDCAPNTGHGTESIFYDTPEVLYVDVHQDPFNLYPLSGFPEQVGREDGLGYTVNISLPPHSLDKNYLFALNEIIVPIAHEYQPELIILVDLNGCHFAVQTNQLMLTLKGLKETVGLFSKLSDQICEGKLIHIGGCSMDIKLLPLGFLATIGGALDVDIELPEAYEIPVNIPDVTSDVEEYVKIVKDIHKTYWKYL